MERPATMLVVGAGSRGKTYAQYAMERPAALQVVGVAEPREFHRNLVRDRFGIPAGNVFEDWTQAAAAPKMADIVCISTQDSMHKEPAVAFAALGYHILLEKPMAVTADDCHAIVAAVKHAGVMLCVGHVLRYTPYQELIQSLLASGAIGDVVNIQHLEPIGSWHFAHSYVRGNWRKESESTFMLMAKCCHDVDVIRAMVGRRCQKVSSFGSLHVFREDRRPAGSGDRCVTCSVEASCPYSAKKLYLTPVMSGYTGWPVEVIVDGKPTVESVRGALEDGPYGRCVWLCDNDVVDNQVVSMQFEGGVTATLTAVAFSEKTCVRTTRIFGTMGELHGDGENTVRVFDFNTQENRVHRAKGAPEDTSMKGHGGADFHLIDTFVRAVRSGNPALIKSGPMESLESHLMVFAAEKSRLEDRIFHMEEAWARGGVRPSGAASPLSDLPLDPTVAAGAGAGSVTGSGAEVSDSDVEHSIDLDM